MWTVYILHDHSLFARGLEDLLKKKDGVEVVGVAPNGGEALAQIESLKPDVVIVDAESEATEPGTVLSKMLQHRQSARVVQVGLENGAVTLYSGRKCDEAELNDLLESIFDPGAFRITGTGNVVEIPNA